MRKQWWWSAILCLVLTGCGGNSGIRNSDPQLQLAEDKLDPLYLPDRAEVFNNYLKNGLRLRVHGGGRSNDDFAAAPAPESTSTDSLSSSGNFSDTNVHVEGVDEADRVKYDGKHLYIAASPRFSYYLTDDGYEMRPGESGVRVVATNPGDASAQHLAFVDLSDADYSLSALYLVADEQGETRDLVGLGHQYDYPAGVWRWNPWWQGNDKVVVSAYDVTAPSAPEQAWVLELDGALAESRKIGNMLYLVTRYSPMIEGLEFNHSSRSQRLHNEQLIANTPIENLLPRYRINGGSAQPLVSSDNCYVPEGIDDTYGYADLVTITAVDLSTRQLMSSVCLNTVISGIHVSADNLYLGASVGGRNDRHTGVHKFALNNGQVSYRGTGVVPGEIGWSAASFRMNEHGDYLRIVTTEMHFPGGSDNGTDQPVIDLWVPPELDHRLSVLREQPGSNRLQLVATLPNEQRPEKIGKPGEDIYAVRFHGDRAYVVTFERIDPLYVLDLSDPEAPRISGELEIPGYSTYLHPIDDGYLLGIGEEVVEVNGWVQTAGIKVELYSVQNLDSAPEVIATQLIGAGGTTSPALYDLRALNLLRTGPDQLRFTLPINVAENYYWQYSALYLFEINGLAGEQANLESAGQMRVEESDNAQGHWWYGGNGYDARSRLHDEAVYYIYGNDVWSAFWTSPEAAQGPN